MTDTKISMKDGKRVQSDGITELIEATPTPEQMQSFLKYIEDTGHEAHEPMWWLARDGKLWVETRQYWYYLGESVEVQHWTKSVDDDSPKGYHMVNWDVSSAWHAHEDPFYYGE